jgi:hypothetical protein
MLIDDIYLHLCRYLPQLTDDLTVNYKNTPSLQKFTVEIIGNDVKITTTDKHNLQPNDHFYIEGIKFIYAIAKLEKRNPNNLFYQDVVTVTTVDDAVPSTNLWKNIEIKDVVSDIAYNGIFDLTDTETFVDAFEFECKNATTINTINNEGNYLLQYRDDDNFYCTPNGFKTVGTIIDDYNFTYSIDEASQFNQWLYKNTTTDLYKPTPTATIDYTNAVIKFGIQIATTLDKQRAFDKYTQQLPTYQGNVYNTIWKRNLWIFITQDRGDNYSDGSITTDNASVYVNQAMDLRIQKDSYFSINAVCMINNELLSGSTLEYFEYLTTNIIKCCVGRTFNSLFVENNYKYSRCVPVDINKAEILPNSKICAYKTIEFKMSTKINNDDLLQPSAGVPVRAFDLKIYTDSDKNELIKSDGLV